MARQLIIIRGDESQPDAQLVQPVKYYVTVFTINGFRGYATAFLAGRIPNPEEIPPNVVLPMTDAEALPFMAVGAIKPMSLQLDPVTQPAPASPPTESDLPAEFPGRKELIAGGLGMKADLVNATEAQIDAVPGIGEKTLPLVLAARQVWMPAE